MVKSELSDHESDFSDGGDDSEFDDCSDLPIGDASEAETDLLTDSQSDVRKGKITSALIHLILNNSSFYRYHISII